VRGWETLIPLFERHEAEVDFIAECVYAYIVNYGIDHPGDNELLNELISFLREAE
jgi:hypothetical protein